MEGAVVPPSSAPIPVAEFAKAVGREIGVSSWFLIDQARIDRFAEAGEDRYFIHVDPERARAETPFGGTIAHGFLSLSLVSAMLYEILPAFREPLVSLNYGLDRVRFLSPVAAGERVRGRFVLAAMEERGAGKWRMRYRVTVEREAGERPALVAEWLTLMALRNAA